MDQEKNKQTALMRQLLRILFGLFSVMLLFYSANGLYQKLRELRLAQDAPARPMAVQILGIKSQKIIRAVPMRLEIPSLNINVPVEHVGITSEGEMDVPQDTGNVGWYQLGPSPGERGSAVIDGHFNGKNNETAVFSNLDKLKPGDKILVINDLGETIAFAVKESRTYRPGYAEEVFSSSDSSIHLNLITCDGVWDESSQSYSERLVVFTDIVDQ